MHRIAVIAGDGVGKEVVPEGVKVLRAATVGLQFDDYDWSSDHYLRTGRMMPEDALATLQGYDAIYLGACGWPTVPDHDSLWGRADEAGGRARDPPGLRRDLPRRLRLADRSRPRQPVGTAAADPEGVRAVRHPPTGQAPAGDRRPTGRSRPRR